MDCTRVATDSPPVLGDNPTKEVVGLFPFSLRLIKCFPSLGVRSLVPNGDLDFLSLIECLRAV